MRENIRIRDNALCMKVVLIKRFYCSCFLDKANVWLREGCGILICTPVMKVDERLIRVHSTIIGM